MRPLPSGAVSEKGQHLLAPLLMFLRSVLRTARILIFCCLDTVVLAKEGFAGLVPGPTGWVSASRSSTITRVRTGEPRTW